MARKRCLACGRIMKTFLPDGRRRRADAQFHDDKCRAHYNYRAAHPIVEPYTRATYRAANPTRAPRAPYQPQRTYQQMTRADRLHAMEEMRGAGQTWDTIGREFNLSGERVRQIVTTQDAYRPKARVDHVPMSLIDRMFSILKGGR